MTGVKKFQIFVLVVFVMMMQVSIDLNKSRRVIINFKFLKTFKNVEKCQ
jgi:hypothetical protein